MKYNDFISKLYIKGAGITKAEFTKELFVRSVSDRWVILGKRNSDEAFKGYNSGHSISAIASDVIDNLNEEGIQKFLEEFFNKNPKKKAEYAQIICNSFKNDIPDITAENICEKITTFFINEVLRPAVKENKKEAATATPPLNSAQAQGSEPATDVDDSTEQDNDSLHNTNHTENYYDNHTDNYSESTTNHSENYYDNHIDNYNENTTNINETSLSSVTNNITLVNDNRSNTITIIISEKNANELAELKALINELNVRFMDLKEKGCVLHSSSWLSSDEEQNEKEQEFESLRTEFIEKNKELRYYYLSFPELSDLFEEIISLSSALTFEFSFTNNAKNQAIALQLEKYESHIIEVREILFK